MSIPMSKDDPAYWMLLDEHTTKPVIYRRGCYICEDPEFAQMGLPLCKPCTKCENGHVAADDTTCDDCGHDVMEEYEREMYLADRRMRRVSTRGSVLTSLITRKRAERLNLAIQDQFDRLNFRQSLIDDWTV